MKHPPVTVAEEVEEIEEVVEVEGGTCLYSCGGWPYHRQCGVKMTTTDGFWHKATCLNPYSPALDSRGEIAKYSNYPE